MAALPFTMDLREERTPRSEWLLRGSFVPGSFEKERRAGQAGLSLRQGPELGCAA